MMRIFFLIGAARSLRKFRRARQGSAAVEFALVAPMFIALLFAIIETGLVFFAGQVLETGTQDTGRLLLTERVQREGISEAAFRSYLCERVTSLFDCSKIMLDLRSFAPGTVITIADPIDTNGALSKNFVFTFPAAGTSNTVVVRAFYEWPLFVTRLGYNIANVDRSTANGKRLLAATSAFRPQ